nr:HDOD domain-containing protein [Desulfobulbaceae bacterium]
MDKPKVLIIEDDTNIQLLYKRIFLEAWFEVYFADDGKAGLDLYFSKAPEIIILDMMMPNVSGYIVLKNIRQKRKDTTTKIFIASGVKDKAEIIACAQLGIQGYIMKPFVVEALRDKFAAYSPLSKMSPPGEKKSAPHNAQSDDQRLARQKAQLEISNKGTSSSRIQDFCTAMQSGEMTPKEAGQKIFETAKAEKLDLPSMPDIIFKIQETMANEQATFKDLGKVIAPDQNISSKLIALSNSALFCGANKCSSVDDAISRVGMQEVKEVVVFLSNRAMHALTDSRFEADLQSLSSHSIACGVASRMVAEHLKYDNPFICFTAGVMHDLGRLILIRIFAQVYKDEKELDMTLLSEVVRKLHPFVGAMFVKNMGFPEKFEQILLKHEKYDQDFDRAPKELTAVVMGNLLANTLDYKSVSNSAEVDIEQTKVYGHTSMTPALIEKIHSGIKQYFEMVGVVK